MPAADFVGHPDADALTAAVATRVAAQLQQAHAAGRPAALAVSGGRSPVPLFRQLAAMPLEWQRTWITLVDERWVPPTSEASNECLVRTHLLQDRASAARFVGLRNAAATAVEGCGPAWYAQAAVPRPFDAVVLGMGEDGHFASLFPDSPGLAEALDPDGVPGCVAMQAPVEPRERISLNLAALLQSRLLLLPITGETKWQVCRQACAADAAHPPPVRAVLAQPHVPIEVHHFP